jgi:hypothetical protein
LDEPGALGRAVDRDPEVEDDGLDEEAGFPAAFPGIAYYPISFCGNRPDDDSLYQI